MTSQSFQFLLLHSAVCTMIKLPQNASARTGPLLSDAWLYLLGAFLPFLCHAIVSLADSCSFLPCQCEGIIFTMGCYSAWKVQQLDHCFLSPHLPHIAISHGTATASLGGLTLLSFLSGLGVKTVNPNIFSSESNGKKTYSFFSHWVFLQKQVYTHTHTHPLNVKFPIPSGVGSWGMSP